jgi:hypothetical protein
MLSRIADGWLPILADIWGQLLVARRGIVLSLSWGCLAVRQLRDAGR